MMNEMLSISTHEHFIARSFMTMEGAALITAPEIAIHTMQLNKYTKTTLDTPEYAEGRSHEVRNLPMLKLVIITNHPPPFRIPVYERIAKMAGVDLHVIFCSRREPNRHWELPQLKFSHEFLRERFVTKGDNFIHNNLDVVTALDRQAPDAIVTTGFNPTFLYAFGYALAKGALHIPMTDGTDMSESALSRWHRLVRRLVYGKSAAFISASAGGQRLYASYGIAAERCFKSCLCIDNEAYMTEETERTKSYDFIFCGRIVEAKGPLFALEVAKSVAMRLGRKIRILYVGSGDQEQDVKEQAALWPDLVEANFNGFAGQDELPALYRSARVFLFPTQADVWGVVANEACAAGLPVLVSPHAGVVGELVLHGENGFVCELDVEHWAARAEQLLTAPLLYERFAKRSRALVDAYTFDHAAAGIVAACRHALDVQGARKKQRALGSVGLG
jgi:glycosyltransferase involved in cell wall biosynthesis